MSLDIDALKALVGEATISPKLAAQYLDETGACADDVKDPTFRPLWALVEERIRRGQNLDAPTIAAALASSGVSRSTVLDVITDPVLGVTQQRLEAFRKDGVWRRIESELRETVRIGRSGDFTEASARFGRAQQTLLGAKSRVRNAAGDSAIMLDHLEQVWAGRRSAALKTGFGALDEETGGLIHNLIVVGAFPGLGKSAFVAGLVRNWARTGLKPGVLAYEDDAKDMFARIVACDAGVTLRHVRGDILSNEEQKSRIHDGLARWSQHEGLVEVDDNAPAGSTAEAAASMRSMVARGCNALILDNVSCLRMGEDNDTKRNEQVEAALLEFRAIARSLHVPVIAVGHLKRGEGNADESKRPPKMSDFSNSSAWEKYSRLAIGMWRDGDDVVGKILKQTNGPPGAEMTFVFQKDAALVTEIVGREIAPPKESRRNIAKPKAVPPPDEEPELF